jgi:dihydropteroate synthase
MNVLRTKFTDESRHPLVMGILNVTPDSFSDGGKYAAPDAAIARAREMVAQGADLIDIGGESTRPGSQPVPEAEQLARVIPVIRQIRAEMTIPISIDTTRSVVAVAALDTGADLVNDISAGLDDPQMLPMVAARKVPIILMHMQGKPLTMQENPTYTDVVGEVKKFLSERLTFAETIGIDPADVLLDPGFGFGKTVAHNYELMRRLPELNSLGRPLLVGVSRKRFIGAITGETGDRPVGTAVAISWCSANGAAILRVHDVAAAVKVTRMIRAIRDGRIEDRG